VSVDCQPSDGGLTERGPNLLDIEHYRATTPHPPSAVARRIANAWWARTDDGRDLPGIQLDATAPLTANGVAVQGPRYQRTDAGKTPSAGVCDRSAVLHAAQLDGAQAN